ncbi:hypothetical protein F3087_19740 [Nocardia colli]|uniref:Nuclear transport factor 2 family protein n=1 Tax=Nocardia colli TaxID=2545717 RepID=A0A5N0EEA6_9NOCA|nr:hypothetical protein [Nocardia colli]KAA8887140.1 hypothetical protein F3087_19740 [Nocardia colli]
MSEQNSGEAGSTVVEPRRSEPSRWLVPVALIVALVAIIVAVVAVLSRDDGSRATSESESAVQNAVNNLVTRYNAGDKDYLKANSCGELYARTTSDTLGGLLDSSQPDGPATARATTSLSDFEYFTQTGKAAQLYARVRLDYGPGQTVSDHVGTFVLLQDDKGTWKVCTAFLLSTTGVA